MIKPRVIIPVLGLLAGLLYAAPARPAAESALIRQRIDALLQRRQKPEHLPTDPPNPFALSAAAPGNPIPLREPPGPGGSPGTPAVIVGGAGEDAGTATTTELLARLASRLRITGLIRIKDQLHAIINDNPWKEGDYLVINQGGRIVRLQVARIQPGQLTLRLEDAELVLRF